MEENGVTSGKVKIKMIYIVPTAALRLKTLLLSFEKITLGLWGRYFAGRLQYSTVVQLLMVTDFNLVSFNLLFRAVITSNCSSRG